MCMYVAISFLIENIPFAVPPRTTTLIQTFRSTTRNVSVSLVLAKDALWSKRQSLFEKSFTFHLITMDTFKTKIFFYKDSLEDLSF